MHAFTGVMSHIIQQKKEAGFSAASSSSTEKKAERAFDEEVS
ncbi:hypothetical protein ACFSCZ_02850 [Siminovitchia sediminis]|uniref:Uncharacterized protein n=1 Tax=Siminovitchia sediminis TaxID=1274353 RepID=A0ABW4KFZ2_9BACI